VLEARELACLVICVVDDCASVRFWKELLYSCVHEDKRASSQSKALVSKVRTCKSLDAVSPSASCTHLVGLCRCRAQDVTEAWHVLDNVWTSTAPGTVSECRELGDQKRSSVGPNAAGRLGLVHTVGRWRRTRVTSRDRAHQAGPPRVLYSLTVKSRMHREARSLLNACHIARQ
jgi:hypothetical protein